MGILKRHEIEILLKAGHGIQLKLLALELLIRCRPVSGPLHLVEDDRCRR